MLISLLMLLGPNVWGLESPVVMPPATNIRCRPVQIAEVVGAEGVARTGSLIVDGEAGRECTFKWPMRETCSGPYLKVADPPKEKMWVRSESAPAQVPVDVAVIVRG